MQLLYIAIQTGRIPILPPVTGSDKYVGPSESRLYLSRVLDLQRLSRDLGIPILEWWQVKKYDSPVVENLGGWSNR